jgi:hypothetical protein
MKAIAKSHEKSKQDSLKAKDTKLKGNKLELPEEFEVL